jgi:hypothetical protein
MKLNRESHRALDTASVSVRKTGRNDWRVTRVNDDSLQPLGFVEQLGPRRFEIVWMSDPIRWGYADSLDDAILAVADGMRFAGEVSDEPESDIDRDDAPLRHRTHHRETWLRRGKSARVA